MNLHQFIVAAFVAGSALFVISEYLKRSLQKSWAKETSKEIQDSVEEIRKFHKPAAVAIYILIVTNVFALADLWHYAYPNFNLVIVLGAVSGIALIINRGWTDCLMYLKLNRSNIDAVFLSRWKRATVLANLGCFLFASPLLTIYWLANKA